MNFDKQWYEEKFKELLNYHSEEKFFIRESDQFFKIQLYREKGLESFRISSFLLSMTKNTPLRDKLDLPNPRFLNYWIIIISYYSMLYLAKALIFTKGYETDDHLSTEVALAKLFIITDELEKEDLEILNQSYKILEDEYIIYFQEARKEARDSRYHTLKSYETEKVNTIHNHAKQFIAKLNLILEKRG